MFTSNGVGRVKPTTIAEGFLKQNDMNNSEKKEVHEYVVEDMCMASQTNKCLQFHTVYII